MRKLSATQIEEIQAHFTSDEVSFPIPDKKYANKRFLHTSVMKCAKNVQHVGNYNMKKIYSNIL